MGNVDAIEGDLIFYDSDFPELPDAGPIGGGEYSRDPGDWPGLPNDYNVPVGSYADFVGEPSAGTWRLWIFSWETGFLGGSITGAAIKLRYEPY